MKLQEKINQKFNGYELKIDEVNPTINVLYHGETINYFELKYNKFGITMIDKITDKTHDEIFKFIIKHNLKIKTLESIINREYNEKE